MEFLKILLGAADWEEGYHRPWLALLNIAAVIAGQNTIITLQTEGEEGWRRAERRRAEEQNKAKLEEIIIGKWDR